MLFDEQTGALVFANRGVGRRLISACLGVALACGLASQVSSAAEPDFQILRGVATGGIWVELAYDATGRAELAILDGLPGAPPETRFITLEAVQGTGCSLEGEGGRIRVAPCPSASGQTFAIRIGDLDAQVLLTPIAPQTSFAWPTDVDFVTTRARCQLPNLSRFAPINGSPLADAVQLSAREAASINPKLAEGRQNLEALRTERLRLYSVIAFSPDEARRNQMLTDAIAGRPVLGRSLSLAEAAQMREKFDREVLQSPSRVKAREQLQQVDRSLSEIYNVQALNQSSAHRDRLVQNAGRLSAGLESTLAARLPTALSDAVQFEGVVAEIDQCLAALGIEQGPSARVAVQKALAGRADEIVQVVQAAVRGAESADAAKSALAPYEGNATIVKALQDGGRGQALAEARELVAQRYAAEDRAQQAAIRQAQIDAARNQVAVAKGGSGYGGRLNVAAVERSVYYIFVSGPDGAFSGTGFAVSDRHIVTNVHVVEGATKIYVTKNGSSMRTGGKFARVVQMYTSDDLAVLEVDGLGAARLPVSTVDPPQGAAIWVMGYLGVADDVIIDDVDTKRVASLSEGVIARVVDGVTGDRKRETRLVQHSANTGSGNSGSPIFDACNRVVGIHNSGPSGSHADRAPTGISASVLARHLKELGIPANFSGGGCGR